MVDIKRLERIERERTSPLNLSVAKYLGLKKKKARDVAYYQSELK